jgi:parvulin-like peptidyl-prolyl isomerase
MKHLPPSPLRHRLAVLAAAFGLALLAAPAAHAFTIEDQSNTNSNNNGAARYSDPDARFSGSGNGQTTIQQGNTTLRFGGQQGSFDQRYNPNRMFDPIDRSGDGR